MGMGEGCVAFKLTKVDRLAPDSNIDRRLVEIAKGQPEFAQLHIVLPGIFDLSVFTLRKGRDHRQAQRGIQRHLVHNAENIRRALGVRGWQARQNWKFARRVGFFSDHRPNEAGAKAQAGLRQLTSLARAQGLGDFAGDFILPVKHYVGITGRPDSQRSRILCMRGISASTQA